MQLLTVVVGIILGVWLSLLVEAPTTSVNEGNR